MVLRLTKVLQRNSELHRSMVTSICIVITFVEIRSMLESWIFFEKDAITVTRCLIFLIHIWLLASRHLVRWNECDWHFSIAWIVTFFLSLNQLVFCWDPIDCQVSDIKIVKFREWCLQSIVKIAEEEAKVCVLVRAKALHLKLQLLHLHLIQKLAGHLISLFLLFLLVLQMTADYIKSMILEYETVTKTTLVSNSWYN